jgi:hypothetical protein
MIDLSMESLTAIILSHFFGIASNLHSDAILTAQKDKLLEELRKDEKARDALRAFRPIVEDVRLACIKLADMHELLWCSPEQERLRPLLIDAHFHNDFVEWLQAGGIEEGEAVKDRILRRIEALLGSNVSNEQLTFLQNHFLLDLLFYLQTHFL